MFFLRWTASGLMLVSVTPPYGLGFMGKSWDHGVPSAEVWSLVLTLLRPGASLFAFGGTRTYHRLTCAIEDAGFEIRDSLCWLYGSGFPKSLDVSKAIDKAAGANRTVIGYDASRARPNRKYEGGAIGNIGGTGKVSDRTDNGATITAPVTTDAVRFAGYGTALKPAWEPIILAVVPLAGTFASNAIEHGVAGLNVDGGRIETTDNLNGGTYSEGGRVSSMAGDERSGAAAGMFAKGSGRLPGQYEQPAGRWPANLVLDEIAAELLDKQTGQLTSGKAVVGSGGGKNRGTVYAGASQGIIKSCYADTGGASRFFYTAKASKRERNLGLPTGATNNHPTVKPLALCEYLSKLLLPPPRQDGKPRRLLVPFCGSGSEMIGALRAGWDEVLGVEMDAGHAALAETRVNFVLNTLEK